MENQSQKTNELELKIGNCSAPELFEKIFDDEVLDQIVNQSNLYALQNNRHDYNLEKYQLKRFLGFLLFSGYHQLPREQMHWETYEDCSVLRSEKLLASINISR